MHYRSDKRRSEPARESIQCRRIFGHKRSRALRQFEHFSKCPTIILKNDLTGLRVGQADFQIDKHRVGGTAALVENNRRSCVIENLTGHDEVASFFGYHLESR